jgi:hypothetical protein
MEKKNTKRKRPALAPSREEIAEKIWGNGVDTWRGRKCGPGFDRTQTDHEGWTSPPNYSA